MQYNTSIGQKFLLASACTDTRRHETLVRIQLDKMGARLSGCVRGQVGDVYEPILATQITLYYRYIDHNKINTHMH